MELKRGYKQSEFGTIPEDWEISKIDSKIDFLTGFPFPSNKYSESGIRLLRGSNIKRGNTDWSQDITQYWDTISPEIKKYVLKKDDIVIAMDGSLVGRSFAQLQTQDLPALLLQRVARLRSEKVDINYLKEYVCSSYFTEHCDKVKTSSAIPHISPKDIKDFTIPFPPTKEEQKAIAQVLRDTDSLLQTLEQKLAKKRAIKQGAMQQLLTPKEGWEVRKLGEIARVIGGGTPSSFNSNYWNGDIDWFTPTEIGKDKYVYKSRRKITEEGFSNSSAQMLPIGTILLTCRAGIGDLAILKNEACSNQGFQSLVANDNISNEFLYYLLRILKPKLIQNASGSTFLEISPGKLKNIEASIPNYKEQTQIATILSDMDAEIAQLEQKLEKYKLLKQGLMQELLTGRIRLV